MNIKFEDINILEKYFFNQVGYTKFYNAMKTVYNDKSYIEPLWDDFRKNPIRFLTSRSEKVVFEWFLDDIEKMSYKG